MDSIVVKIVDSIKQIYDKDISCTKKRLSNTFSNNTSIVNKFENCLDLLLIEDIVRITIKTFVYEFHQYRIKLNIPVSTKSNLAFNKYIDEISVEEVKNWFVKYPQLEKMISTCIINDCKFINEISSNYASDEKKLISKNIIEYEDKIKKIYPSNSDPHNGSKRVVFFEYTNGNKILYKPRSLAIDEMFSSFFNVLKKAGNWEIENPVPGVLVREFYGWQKFVKKEYVKINDLDKVYYNLGLCAAVFSSVGSTDMHDENLIFRGTNPYFIDLETGLNPSNGNKQFNLLEQMSLDLNQSIVGTSIIPAKLSLQSYGILIGAINTPFPQKTQKKVFTMINFGTDAIDIAKKDYAVSRIANPLEIEGDITNNPLLYQDDFIKGFRAGISTILEKKSDLIKILNQFEGTIRVILRPTAKYFSVLEACLFPENMISESSIDKILNYLQPPKLIQNIEHSKEVFNKEKESLKIGDIPAFYVKANNSKVETNDFSSNEVFEVSPIKNAIEILSSISNKWLAFNERLISEGFYYVREQMSLYSNKEGEFLNSPIFKEALEKMKISSPMPIVDVINDMASVNHDNSKIGWIGGIYTDFQVSYMSGTFCSFHDTGGILNLLEHIGKDKKSIYEKMKKGLVDISASLEYYNSIPSIIVGKESLEFLYGHKQNKLPFLEKVIMGSQKDDIGDIFYGNVGLYLALSSFEIVSDEALEKIKEIDKKQYTYTKFGIAHGELGYLWAKFRIAKRFDDDHLCKEILHKILSMYEEQEINSIGWCNGLSGLFMILSEISQYFEIDETILYKLSKRITQINENKAIDISICHGVSGILQTLLFVYKIKNEKYYLDLANTFWKNVIDISKKRGFYTGEKNKDHLLGYFLGWSGFADSSVLLNNFNKNQDAWIPLNISTDYYQEQLRKYKL